MRILVTGANGFVGRHAVARLEASGHEVVAASLDGAGVGGARPVRLDVRDYHVLVRLLESERPDAILHLAAIAFVPEARRHPRTAFETNAMGSVNVLTACQEATPEARVVLISTSEVYGIVTDPASIPISESTTVSPVTIYGASKAAAEHAAAVSAREGLDVVVLRPFNHIGPGQSEDFVLASFARQIAAMEQGAEPVLRHGNLDAVRDFLDVRDIVRAYEMALVAPFGQLSRGAPYNVCSGKGTVISEIVGEMIARARRPVETELDEDRLRPSDVPVSIGDPTRFRDATGFESAFALGDTLDAILADARSRLS